MPKKQKRTIQRIRTEISDPTDAYEQATKYKVDNFDIDRLFDDYTKNVPPSVLSDEKWIQPRNFQNPFNIKTNSKLSQFNQSAVEFLALLFSNYSVTDPSLALNERGDMTLSREMPKEKGLRDPKYSLNVEKDFVTELESFYKNSQQTRFASMIHVKEMDGGSELPVFAIFYKQMIPKVMVIELYYPDYSVIDEHPAFTKIDEKLASIIGKSLDAQLDVLIGVFESQSQTVTEKQLFEFLPFLQTIRGLDRLFPILWDMYLFVDRVREKQYTLKEVEMGINEFRFLSAEIRIRAFLEFFIFVSQFRYFLIVKQYKPPLVEEKKEEEEEKGEPQRGASAPI